MKLLPLSLSLFLAACNLSGGGTDVGNPEITGSLRYRDGSPVAFVPIHLRPKAFYAAENGPSAQAGKEVQDGFSDTQGFFTFDSVPPGEYRIEAVDTSGRGAIMEVSADGRTGHVTLDPVYLDSTGWISGKVGYLGPPQAVPPKIFISVFGMDRWTVANSAGDFTLSGLPPGKYALRVHTQAAGGLTTLVDTVTLGPNGRVSVGTVDLGP